MLRVPLQLVAQSYLQFVPCVKILQNFLPNENLLVISTNFMSLCVNLSGYFSFVLKVTILTLRVLGFFGSLVSGSLVFLLSRLLQSCFCKCSV